MRHSSFSHARQHNSKQIRNVLCERCGKHGWAQMWFVQIFGSGLICPKGSNMLRAEIQRALRRAPRQLRGLRLGLQTRRGSNHSATHGSESNSRSNVFQIPSQFRLRAQPLESSLGRVPQAADVTCNKISQTRSCRSPRTV